jgi:exosome complex RNA-binding protein Csl4
MKSSRLQFTTPGELLGSRAEFDAGAGTYERGTDIVASVVGTLKTLPVTRHVGKRGTLVVERLGSQSLLVPDVGATVTCRITRLTLTQANAEILLLAGMPVAEPFHAVIRKENVRQSEIDKVGFVGG